MIFFKRLLTIYSGYVNLEMRERVKRHVSSCTELGQVIYQDFQVSGRMLRPHQGDTVSPRRGLNIPATD